MSNKLGVFLFASIILLAYSSLSPSVFAETVVAIPESKNFVDFLPIQSGPDPYTHDSDVVTDPGTSVSCDSQDGSMTSPNSNTSADSEFTTVDSPTDISSAPSDWSGTSWESISSNDSTDSGGITSGGNGHACSITDLS